MRILVLLFGPLAESAGWPSLSLDLVTGATVEDAALALEHAYPLLQLTRGSFASAVNERYVPRGHALADGDRLALIPPVSGG